MDECSYSWLRAWSSEAVLLHKQASPSSQLYWSINGQPQGQRLHLAPSQKQPAARIRSDFMNIYNQCILTLSSTDRGRYLWLLQWCWVWNVSSLDASGCILPLLTQPQWQGLPGEWSRRSIEAELMWYKLGNPTSAAAVNVNILISFVNKETFFLPFL